MTASEIAAGVPVKESTFWYDEMTKQVVPFIMHHVKWNSKELQWFELKICQTVKVMCSESVFNAVNDSNSAMVQKKECHEIIINVKENRENY